MSSHNLKVTPLDTLIRKKADAEARTKFHRMKKELLKDGHSSTWNPSFTFGMYKEMETLLDRYLEGIVAPVAQQKAVADFYATYLNLLGQYPELQVEAETEEGDA